jgi:hypothetical protein
MLSFATFFLGRGGGGVSNFHIIGDKKLNSFKSVKLKTIVNIFGNICQTFETTKLKKNQVFVWYGL